MERKFFIAEIETCSDMMYRVAWSILRNDADVQDALQDAALKAWEKRDKLRDEKFFRIPTRCFSGAANTITKRRRRKDGNHFPRRQLPGFCFYGGNGTLSLHRDAQQLLRKIHGHTGAV